MHSLHLFLFSLTLPPLHTNCQTKHIFKKVSLCMTSPASVYAWKRQQELWFAGDDWEKEGGRYALMKQERGRGRERESTVPISVFFALRFRQPAFLSSPPPPPPPPAAAAAAAAAAGRREEGKHWMKRTKIGTQQRKIRRAWKTSAAGELRFFPLRHPHPLNVRWEEAKTSAKRVWKKILTERSGSQTAELEGRGGMKE